MSLRDRFNEAHKIQQLDRNRNYDLQALSGEMAVLAARLPAQLEELVIRMEAGEALPNGPSRPALQVTFKTPYYPRYTSDYNTRRYVPAREEMEALRGYQKLLETCADPAIDVCITISLSKPSTYREDVNVTIDVMPGQPFADSRMNMPAPHGRLETHAIGKEYEPQLKKPFKAPATLTLRGKP